MTSKTDFTLTLQSSCQEATGRARLADFRAQGFVVHCDALTLARSTITQIVRRGLVTQKDGSPIRTIGINRPHAKTEFAKEVAQ